MQHVVVIGAGVGGLGAAIRMQAAGAKVTLLERLDRPGGRGAPFEIDGYQFDAGPTIITELPLIQDLWRVAGRRIEDYVSIVPLDPAYRVYFSDDTFIDYTSDPQRMAAQIRSLAPGDDVGYERLMTTLAGLYERAFVKLAREPFLTPWSMLKVLPAMLRTGAWRPVYHYIKRFFKDERMRQLFSFQSLFIGGNPFRASAIYAVIPYLEREGGVHFAMGGTAALINGIAKLFQDLGGEIIYNATVNHIEIQGGRATGVTLEDGRSFPADAVVSNADVATTYRRMIPEQHRPTFTDRKLDRMRYTMSCFLLYIGVNRTYEHLPHHTVLLRGDFRTTIRQIFDRKQIPDQPSYYLHIPSRSDASLAPEGCDTIYVLAPVPHMVDGINWQTEGQRLRDKVIDDLEAFGMAGLRESIVVEKVVTPVDFAQNLLAERGNAFAFEPTILQSAYFRPHNRAQDVRGLYFVGAGTHPGAGIPGVLLSAEVTTTLVKEDLGVKRAPAAQALAGA